MRAARVLRAGAVDALVVALFVAGLIETAVESPSALRLLFVALWTLPLLFRRRFPLAAPGTVFLALAVESLLDGHAVPDATVAFVTGLFAFWVVGAYNERQRAVIGAACGYAALAVVVLDEPDHHVSTFLSAALIATVAWFTGVALHTRAEHAAQLEERAAQLEARRLAEARAAAAEERARIARELHDVVAHSVSVMTVQAGGVRRLLHDDQVREREALETVERTGRAALAELRRLLGVLRDADDAAELAPQPSLERLDALLDRVRAAGLPVELELDGAPTDLPPGVDMSAYRIVQEALTNAIKHGGEGTSATVRVRYGPRALELEVANDGASPSNGDGRGHGLIGMRERAAVVGGTVETGPRPGGGFIVKATLPLESAR